MICHSIAFPLIYRYFSRVQFQKSLNTLAQMLMFLSAAIKVTNHNGLRSTNDTRVLCPCLIVYCKYGWFNLSETCIRYVTFHRINLINPHLKKYSSNKDRPIYFIVSTILDCFYCRYKHHTCFVYYSGQVMIISYVCILFTGLKGLN